MKQLIYCVEDDLSIRELIVYTLKISDFEGLGLKDGNELFAALDKNIPDLIILDIMLPGKSGLDILKELKADNKYKDIPIIMATAKTSEFDRVIGLDSGADDYLSKPFGMMEMISRIKAVLRRRGNDNSDSNVLKYKNIEIDKLKRTVKVDDKEIDLTLKEYELLLCFVERPDIVFSREQLLEKVWGSDFLGESRTIDVHIGTLRNKLGNSGEFIKTVHGIGYCLRDSDGK